jgi:Holliday junction resolvase
MTPRSKIQKGKLLEQHVADQLREKGLDDKAYRAHGSGNGNREKADIWTSMMILGQNAGIECKNQSKINIPDWWRQTQKLEKLGREPVLVFKLPYEPLGGTLAVVYLDTLLDLIKNQK